jgi:hypothetical protein
VSNLCHHRKESAKDRLNSMKNGSLYENRDLNVINAKIWVLLCKLMRFKSNSQSLLKGQNVRIQVIMTSHENLQMCPKLYEIYPSKDKSNSNTTFVQNLTCKAISFGFLNLSPKTIL